MLRFITASILSATVIFNALSEVSAVVPVTTCDASQSLDNGFCVALTGLAVPSGITYVGCIADPISTSMTLLATSNKLTPAACVNSAVLQQYTYAGLRNGVECWVSKTSPSPAFGTCNVACSGAASLNCGGATATTVYNVPQSTVVSGYFPQLVGVKLPANFPVDGSGNPVSTTYTTLALAKAACNNLYSCVGVTCDLTSANCVLSATSSPGSFQTPLLISSASNTAQIRNVAPGVYRVGCYSDPTGTVLSNLLLNSVTLTKGECFELANTSGYVFAGFINGVKCYGGNSIATTTTLTAGSCSSVCSGDRLTGCGGPTAVNVFNVAGLNSEYALRYEIESIAASNQLP